MNKVKLEYIWTDGYTPEPNFRSKTKVIETNSSQLNVKDLPQWSFDGSSTQQAEGNSSDCILNPVRMYKDTARKNAYLVLCEVLNADGSLHSSNNRGNFADQDDIWFGFEQEYVIMQNGKPLGFPAEGFPAPQGMYYCGVGSENVKGRQMVEEHLDICLDAGINLTGINAEVMVGQWEYQVLGKGAKKAADDLMMSRYLLYRISEKYGLQIDIRPKPVQGDWNGSGLHTNFSNDLMRNTGGKELMRLICETFGKNHNRHIASYGADNDLRLTGLHETQSIDKFSYGISDRGASIRIPVSVIESGWKGYLEDRRPGSNADPYLIASEILSSLNEALETELNLAA